MGRVKQILCGIRDGMAYAFSWLVICTVAVSLIGGKNAVPVSFLIKLFALCLWAVISFMVCFKTQRIQKKGFIFSLTLFYILFIPVEVLMFFAMHIFSGTGNPVGWIVFGVIVALSYLLSLLIDHFVMKRDAEVYTRKILDYTSKKT